MKSRWMLERSKIDKEAAYQFLGSTHRRDRSAPNLYLFSPSFVSND